MVMLSTSTVVVPDAIPFFNLVDGRKGYRSVELSGIAPCQIVVGVFYPFSVIDLHLVNQFRQGSGD
ncbi:hypothetical protein AKG39_00680 [Acetobacterium bakii]|uniref:Uncharacterized protein n=1 Tax=Acetobacterium bakii TaxID=52689 RepID=A0A0L6U6P9_9FIRM|nr:hypothetical protein AKG39_00680 [Acetobacterium bakii]